MGRPVEEKDTNTQLQNKSIKDTQTPTRKYGIVQLSVKTTKQNFCFDFLTQVLSL
jgi:hypothetical protein